MTQAASAPDFASDPAQVERPAPLLGLCSVQAGGLMGLEFQKVTVEVSSRRGPAFFQLAGLAEAAVREARIRIASALGGLGVTLDEYALTVNLAPAHVRKSGSGLDLAIAIAILGAIGEAEIDDEAIFLGEVSLNGNLRPIPGILPLLDGAKNRGAATAYVPAENAREASQVSGITVHPVASLAALLGHLRGAVPLLPLKATKYTPRRFPSHDLKDVQGQASAKRALVVAAAGHHHLLLVGPPGSGKSMLAQRLAGLLPPLGEKEALETTALHSVAGLLDQNEGVVSAPPFRAPHHTVSEAGLVGGGALPRPGEISLAHNGVLFLDEMPEFRRSSLESLRQPLENHEVLIVRAKMRARFPARPLLVGAMNPCPCGNFGNPRVICRCDRKSRLRYLSRVSGPLLDRIDLHVLVPPVDLRSWTESTTQKSLSSAQASQLVDSARAMQQDRFVRNDATSASNSLLSLKELKRVATPGADGKQLLDAAIEKNLLSARGYVRVLRLSRTLADLAGAVSPTGAHIAEALRYRLRDLAEL